MKNALILLAGGEGKRMGLGKPKQFLINGGQNLIEYFLSNLNKNLFDIIILSCKYKYRKKYLNKIKNINPQHNIKFSNSGSTRQLTVKYSLEYLKKFKPKKVIIHDSARPLASNKLFKKIIKNLDNSNSVIPYISNNDFSKTKK